MSTPQTLTDEQAAAIWSGDTAAMINYNQPDENSEVIEPKPDTEEIINTPAPNIIDQDDLDGIFRESNEDDEDEPEVQATAQPKETQTSTNTEAEDSSKRGRKPADLVNVVNQMIQEDVLFGFEDKNGAVLEIKTIEEAKELIKENLKYKEDNAENTFWKKKVESYSPQIQAILHYAEKGGQDVTPLINAISEVERNSDLDVEDEKGQEEIVTQVLKIKGFDEEEIKDQIDTLKDLDRLKAKATKFLPELNKMKEQRIQLMLQEQNQRNEQAKEATRIYLETVQRTLDKEQVGPVRLKREDKFKIVDALAEPKYTSINGFKVNEFVKVIEDLQFGKNQDYDHFLNLVHYAVDKQGFLDKLKESLTNDVTVDQVRRLKTAKNNVQTSQTEQSNERSTRTNVIRKDGFKNPYSTK